MQFNSPILQEVIIFQLDIFYIEPRESLWQSLKLIKNFILKR